MELPNTVPTDDPAGMWKMQCDLLDMAEHLLGQRDYSFCICQPEFGTGPPIVLSSPNNSSERRAVFSSNARFYWPTVVYELAHETIHLLNPVTHSEVTYLEEGVAVAFSIHAQKKYRESAQEPNPDKREDRKYAFAYSLVEKLPDSILGSGKKIRQKVGRLSDATAIDLRDLYPGLEHSIAEKLASKFNNQQTQFC